MTTIRTATFFALLLAATAADATPRLGVQLWSVKDEIKQDFTGTLEKIGALGFQGVEFAGEFGPYKDNPAGLKTFLDKHRLQCAGAHVHFDQLAAEHFDATTAFYRTLGCTNLIIPMDARGASATGSLEMSKQLTALSGQLAAKGMRIGYHNHAQELAGAVGATPWDVIAKNTPQAAILQQDVGWTTYAGKDPVAYVKKYPGRTVSTHFKAKFVEGTSGTPIIGQDKTDWAGLARAVRQVGGTDWIIVEQEEYPNGMGQLESVAASLKGLQAVLAKLPQ
ncbi:sugar phosphate isomerase/epimerase [Pseudoduganella flava]|uniref:Sugar phosphate isomerase/epimerase n=1 Tax=Pseudoduganella flava TaxID=871742 RepID=A0A562Q102_9BURK|nr:sugar phosphate isomerase/epimerase [Pseudoduganella flava]QGZ38111.1 TIM barrel protein [Pseudoduganella flava]TWI50375.1 sugar phosphate isomerase/epimerase [Pseudoduganella flava]